MRRRGRVRPGTPPAPGAGVTIGVDTHADLHVAAALDAVGRLLGTCAVPSTPAGFAERAGWAGGWGRVAGFGIEGTGCYGAGLARWLRARGYAVVEVDRPQRQFRRRRGKSDPVDAEAAARAVLAGAASAQPKAGDGPVEALRVVRLARTSAVKARTQAANQLHALVVTAPEPLRARLRALPLAALVDRAAAFRIASGASVPGPLAATRFALRLLARRYRQRTAEIRALEAHLAALAAATAPALLAVRGVGAEVAATLRIAAGDNPERLRSEAAVAHRCGVAPIPASSGKVVRHRLNRGGDRQANRALHVVALVRLRWDARTRAYVARRTAEGRPKLEILRCLKRYVARQLYPLLRASLADQPSAPHLPAAAGAA